MHLVDSSTALTVVGVDIMAQFSWFGALTHQPTNPTVLWCFVFVLSYSIVRLFIYCAIGG